MKVKVGDKLYCCQRQNNREYAGEVIVTKVGRKYFQVESLTKEYINKEYQMYFNESQGSYHNSDKHYGFSSSLFLTEDAALNASKGYDTNKEINSLLLRTTYANKLEILEQLKGICENG